MPAPHRRSRGESLAKKIEAHAAPRSIDDRRDRLISQRSRIDAKWEEAAARLSPRSDLEQRATQARTDDERARHLSGYSTAVRRGQAKPPVVVLTPAVTPRYFLGLCLDCSREMWVFRSKPRVPVCPSCREKR